MDTILPGWYADPAAPESGNLRWWNGEVWTTHVQGPQAPIPVFEAPAEPEYVPFSQATASMFVPEAQGKKRTPPRFFVIAAALVVALGAGAFFGIPTIFGPSGPLASAAGYTPAVTTTPIAVQPDLPPTPTPPGTANVPLTQNSDTTAAAELGVETASIAKQNNSVTGCDPLWYTSPVLTSDTTSTDPLQILPVYANKGILISAISRQFSTVDAAAAEQGKLRNLITQCQAGYTDEVGKVTTTAVGAAFAPTQTVGWQATVTASGGKKIKFVWVEERVANRSVRIVCAEKTHDSTAADTCSNEMANVSHLLAQTAGTLAAPAPGNN